MKALEEVGKRFPQGLPLLDPEEDMKIKVRACICCVSKTQERY